eukprot:19540-Prorocentrum_minimum.AAC.1
MIREPARATVNARFDGTPLSVSMAYTCSQHISTRFRSAWRTLAVNIIACAFGQHGVCLQST